MDFRFYTQVLVGEEDKQGQIKVSGSSLALEDIGVVKEQVGRIEENGGIISSAQQKFSCECGFLRSLR